MAAQGAAEGAQVAPPPPPPPVLAALDPTAAECAAFDTVGSVMRWAGLRHGDANDPDSAIGSFLALMGMQMHDHFRLLGVLPAGDYDTIIQNWQIAGSPPTPAQRAMAALVGSAARVACGTQLRVEDQRAAISAAMASSGSPAVAATAASTSGDRIRLSNVLDQTSDDDCAPLSNAEVDGCYARFDRRLGGYPPEDQEPTSAQLSALHHLVATRDQVPYVDFAIFGPHAIRIVRKLKLTGLMLGPSGELFRSEMLGPMSYEQWAACFAVYRTAMVMLGFASPAALDSYHDHIRQYATRYTTECWALLYQTDTRARRELSERIRRRRRHRRVRR